MNDKLYKMWWYMVMYGASVEIRCKRLDLERNQ